METWLNAAIMGLVEGITEFLPVSSTGHLLLMNEILAFNGPQGNVFEIVIQLGAILAVMVVYFARLWRVAVTVPTSEESRQFVSVVVLAFLPAMVVGYFAHDFIKAVLFNPMVVAVSLIVGGVAILWIEKRTPAPRVTRIEAMSWKTALWIGVAQCLAMVPGISRSGATIMGSLLLRVERRVAAEFSFFLAIPTMVAATAYDIYKNLDHLSVDDGMTIAVGFTVAFISALVVVRGFVDFVGQHGFAPFAWYRIIVGCVALFLLI